MLTDQEKGYLKAAFDAAIKASPDAMAAAAVLIALQMKIESMDSQLQKKEANV